MDRDRWMAVALGVLIVGMVVWFGVGLIYGEPCAPGGC